MNVRGDGLSGSRRTLWVRRVVLAAILLLVVVSSAAAQARARVKQDGTTVWRPGFMGIAAVVSAGTELEVIARSGEWLEVLVPARPGGARTSGFIAATAVDLTGVVPEQAPDVALSDLAGAPQPRRVPAVPRTFSRNRLRLFGAGGYGWFSARRSFDALFGARGGGFYGGGAEIQSPSGAFVQGSMDYFRLRGQRVFVSDGDVFRLGITDVVTILPVHLTVGYRVSRGRLAPYGGAGLGRHFLRDDFDFADAAARKFQSFTSYHAVLGIEWWAARRVGAAFEVQYSHVPDALGGGVGADLGEDNLGGTHARVKLLYGR